MRPESNAPLVAVTLTEFVCGLNRMRTRSIRHFWIETASDRYGSIDPPERPCNLPPTATPLRHADEHNHVDNGRESHRKGAQKETLSRVADHRYPNLRVETISQGGDCQKDNEEEHVEREQDIRDILQPTAVIR